MLLDLKNISASFHLRGSAVHAVRNVSLSISQGETVGIVGESGSGKTVLSLSLLRLLPSPPAVVNGEQTALPQCSFTIVIQIPV